jgi:hypothetical protein
MSAAPIDVQMNAAIEDVDKKLAQVRDRIYADYLSKGKPVPIDAIRQMTDLMEMRHAYLTQKTYPQARVFTQIKFEAVMTPDGTEGSLRGKTKRRPDIGVLFNGKLWLIECKVEDEVLRIFKDDPKARQSIEGALRKSSNFGRQFQTETKIIRSAERKGPFLLTSGVEVGDTARKELPLVEVDGVQKSRIQIYGNLGDGLPIPSPESGTSRPVSFIDAQPSTAEAQAAKLNQPVALPPPKTAQAGKTPSTIKKLPTAAEAAKGTPAEEPAAKKSAIPPESVAPKAPSEDERVRAARGLGANEVPEPAPETPGKAEHPAPLPPSTRGTVQDYDNIGIMGRWQTLGYSARDTISAGVAQAFHDFMAGRMYKTAEDAAEKAASTEYFTGKVFKARNDGAWVLVIANFSQSKVPDATGTRLLVFHDVDMVTYYERPGDTTDEIMNRLERQITSRPQSARADVAHPSDYRDPFANGNWETVTQKMALYPGEPPQTGTRVRYETKHIGRLTEGRCVIEKLY